MKHALTTLAAAAALALAGCGASGAGGTGTAASAPGAAATSSTTSAPAPRVGDVVPAKELSERTTAAIRKAGTVRISMGSGADALTGAMSYRNGLAYRMSGTSGGETMEMIYVDKVFYMGGAGFAELTGGRKFVRIDPAGSDEMSRMMGPFLSQLERAANPSEVLSALDGLTAKVVKVEGDRTTYETSMTAGQLLQATEKMLGQKLPADSAKELKALTMRQVVDGQGRLVQVTTAGVGDDDITMSYSDYGAAVEISAPPANQVGSLDLGGLVPTPTAS